MRDVLVLCYHAVSETWPADLSIEPRRLHRQLRSLTRRGYRGATFTRAVTDPPHPRTLAVTFDDAYRSVGALARPVLESLGLVGTVFAPTDHVGVTGPMTWPGIDQWQDGPHAHELVPMSWPGLRELAQAGWEVGSHTCSHPHLTECSDTDLARELKQSREVCEREMQAPCSSIAYPYGDVDERVRVAAGGAGYRAGAALPAVWHAEDRLQWPRPGIYHDDGAARFALKASALVRRGRARIRPPRAGSGA